MTVTKAFHLTVKGNPTKRRVRHGIPRTQDPDTHSSYIFHAGRALGAIGSLECKISDGM